MKARAAAFLLALCCGCGMARADRLVVSVSQEKVRITSGFAGADLVVFGVADPDDAADGSPDVVVTVRGPSQTFTTWRKTRLLGLWVNSDSRTFLEVPSFLDILTSRPPEEMADADALRLGQIGLARVLLKQRIGTDYADVVPADPFRAAFLRIQQAQGLYREDTRGVSFIAPHVFRAEVAIPGTAPLGRYEVEVKLLRGGRLTASAATAFDVQKTGFEQKIAEFSQRSGLLYGLAVALGSLAIGFIGNLLFRKE
ncbi:TIGR02186 family protein [Xanthobacter autotrophicus DSM 431]|uniref:TIGR02186 family protein n=1 Tax=Xanthobacter nonsaccharivorans TaxID=3119912 RepID=UPI003726DCAB